MSLSVVTQILAKYGNLPTISICQPYASACMTGPKRVENRLWRQKITGRVIVHASRSRTYFVDGPKVAALWPAAPELDAYPRGLLLGTIDIIGCFTEDEAAERYPEMIPWITGPYCFMFKNPEPFPPELQADIKGRQKFFYLGPRDD